MCGDKFGNTVRRIGSLHIIANQMIESMPDQSGDLERFFFVFVINK